MAISKDKVPATPRSGKAVLKGNTKPQVNKLYQVLQHLDGMEFKRLSKFMRSPYFNHSKNLTLLCDILLGLVEDNKEGFVKEKVWSKLFSDQPYDDTNFRKMCSDLLKLVSLFLVTESYHENAQVIASTLMNVVTQRDIKPLYNSAINEVKTHFDKKQQGANLSSNKYQFHKNYYRLQHFDSNLEERANLEEISIHLDYFFIIEKLKIYTEVLSRKKTSNHAYSIDFMEPILEHLKQTNIANYPDVEIYFNYILLLLNEDQEVYYQTFVKSFYQHIDVLTRKEAVDLMDSVLHYCVLKANRGNSKYLEEYINLTDIALQKDIFIEKNEIPVWRFNNIVGAALRLGRLVWCEEFIKEYKDMLPKEIRENTYRFNLARVYRYQKKYEQVLQLLQDVEYEDIGYSLISKTILLITYYEIDEYDALDSFMESFRVYINRNKNITEQRKMRHLNLIKYTKRLTRLMPGDKPALHTIREEITNNIDSLVNSEWLIEKIDELL